MIPIIRYPMEDIPPQLQLLITPLKINRKKALKSISDTAKQIGTDTFSKSNGGKIVSFTTTPSKQSLMLPIPSSFTTNLSHSWNEIQSFYSDIMTNIKGALTGALANIGKIQTLMAGEGLSAYEPKIVHYASTQPLEFTFNWKFTPKQQEEANRVFLITKIFQLGGMPKGIKGKDDKSLGILRAIKSPHLWKLQFQPNLKDPTVMSKHYFFKNNTLDEMILTSCNANYTPDGDFYPMVDGSPTTLDLSLTFKMSRSILSYAKVFGLESAISPLVDSILPD
jgi:hypothetical protein